MRNAAEAQQLGHKADLHLLAPVHEAVEAVPNAQLLLYNEDVC